MLKICTFFDLDALHLLFMVAFMSWLWCFFVDFQKMYYNWLKPVCRLATFLYLFYSTVLILLSMHGSNYNVHKEYRYPWALHWVAHGDSWWWLIFMCMQWHNCAHVHLLFITVDELKINWTLVTFSFSIYRMIFNKLFGCV